MLMLLLSYMSSWCKLCWAFYQHSLSAALVRASSIAASCALFPRSLLSFGESQSVMHQYSMDNVFLTVVRGAVVERNDDGIDLIRGPRSLESLESPGIKPTRHHTQIKLCPTCDRAFSGTSRRHHDWIRINGSFSRQTPSPLKTQQSNTIHYIAADRSSPSAATDDSWMNFKL
jgi:hypothetical protein